MSKLVWDQTGERLYESGVKKGVLYPQNSAGLYPSGVAWNGLTAINENPSGAEATPLYANDAKYLSLMSAEEFAASIEAYMYPDEWAQCDGSAEIADGVSIGQQARSKFGLCYRTILGNDTEGEEYGYKLHLIYGGQATPSQKQYATVNDSPDAITMSWDVTTTPVAVTGRKPTATLVIDSTKVADATKLQAIEDILYGVTAPTFSESAKYALGEYVTYETAGKPTVYKCTTAIAVAGAWVPGSWAVVTNPGPRLPLPDEIASVMAAG